MKHTISLLGLLFLFFDCLAQAGMWTWMKGDTASNPSAVYGTQGIPAAANKPPGLYEASPWTDVSGNFWLFGGSYFPSSSGVSGDLWKYDPLANQWTWMKGSGIPDDTGSYGTKGVPALSNNPPARGYGSATWVDANGDFWLFGGGIGYSDLWRYTIAANTWTWIHGPSTYGMAGIYGTQGIPSVSNNPGGRSECGATWTDVNGDLWLMGGYGIGGSFNDLWRYHVASDEWTWMKGSSLPGSAGVYGTLGTPHPNNVPAGRWTYCSWTDDSGNLLLFGGWASPAFSRFNDMWKYVPSTNNWTWISGTNTLNGTGTYGPLCTPSVNFVPASRFENRARWKDDCGRLWLYGGGTSIGNLPDLWNFDESSLKWNLIDGGYISAQTPVFGTMGIPTPANTPGGRNGALSWTSLSGELYLFGGYVNAGAAGINTRNDVWKFVIDTICAGNCSPTGLTETKTIRQILAAPDPAHSSFTISFQILYAQPVEIIIYNPSGSLIYFSKLNIPAGKFSKVIDVQSYRSGMYFLQIKTPNGLWNEKIIVQH